MDEINKCGGFNVTKWASNSEEVLSHVDDEGDRGQSDTIDFNESEPQKSSGNLVEYKD